MELCKHLSYQRSLSPSKAVFFYKTDVSEFEPLQVEINRVQGQKCSHSEAYQSGNQPKNIQPQDLAYSNPVTIDTCYVPPTVNELYCRFSLRVEANSLHPLVCSDESVHLLLCELANKYKAAGGYLQLAERYCKNILLGGWLWRNQHARSMQIEILTSDDQSFVIEDATKLAWDNWPKKESSVLKALAAGMESALTDPSVFWFADITAKIQTTFCQEIIPSQCFTDHVARGEALSYLMVETPRALMQRR